MVFSNSFTWENITSLPSCQLSGITPTDILWRGALLQSSQPRGHATAAKDNIVFPFVVYWAGSP